MKHFRLFLCLASTVYATCIFAQDIRSSTTGFSFGLHGKFTDWTSTSNFVGSLDEDDPNGIGIGARIAYGLNESFSFYFGYAHANYAQNEDWDQYTHQLLHLGLRVNFGATLKSLRPYLQAGVGQHTMKIDPIIFGNDFSTLYALKMNGIGGEAGIGLQYFATPSLAIDIGVFGRFGNFSGITLNGVNFDPETSTDFRFLGLEVGVTYFLQ
ncbi:MAG: outer membrane beta-barrel protein [Saprospiraceae bacterium]|nr:outer membrane beta-barrel protein [Saprospiraceae bacterium]